MLRNNNLDWLKLTLALMVVNVHYSDLLPWQEFKISMIDNGLFRVAVPIFFIFNGYFLYNAIQKGATLNYIKRILYLYIFWSLIYLFFFLTSEHRSTQALLSNLVFGFHHLWYLPAVIMASLIIAFTNRINDSARVIIFLCLFIIGTGIQYGLITGNLPAVLDNACKGRLFTYRNGIFFAPIFMLIGYLVNKHKLNEKISNKQTWAPLIIGFMLLFIEAIYNNQHPKAAIDMMFSLPVLCTAIFLFVITVKKQTPALNGDIANAIYFTHPFVRFSAEYLNIKFEYTVLIYSAVTALIVLLMINLPKNIKKVVL